MVARSEQDTILRTENPPMPEFIQVAPIPVWWHFHGYEMELSRKESNEDQVVIKTRAAEVSVVKGEEDNQWKVSWKLIHSYGNNEVEGKIVMNDRALAAAFGLTDENISPNLDTVLRKHGGTVGFQGHYLRFRNHLNIPGPGTGHDGDPNVSIYLIDDIKEAVGVLLEKPATT